MNKTIVVRTGLSLILVLVAILSFIRFTGTDSTASTAPIAESKKLIKFVVPDYSSASKPYFENLVSEFESKYPQIEIELQVINWDIIDSVYKTMISRDQPPDLLLSNLYAHFASDGLLNPMDELLSPELKNKLYPFLANPHRVNGVQYSIPYVSTIRELYYNKDLFDEAGIKSAPATWAELEDTARTIKSELQVDGFGVDLTDNEIWAYLSYFFIGAGGGWMKDGLWDINSPANIEGLTFLKKLYDEGLTDSEPTVTTRDEKQRVLGNGKLGMLISGNYFETVVPYEYKGLRWSKGQIPVKEGTAPFRFGVQDVLLSFKTDHTDKEALSIFLDFLYDDARYEELVLREGFLPVIRTVGDKLSANNASMTNNLEALRQAIFYPIHEPAWSTVLDATRNMGQAVLYGSMTPKQALDRLQQIALSRTS